MRLRDSESLFYTWGGMYKSTFFEYRSNTYYVDANGVMAVGWKQIDGTWYYFHDWGGMYKSTFFEYLNNTYYVDENGMMAVGWKQISGNWYYFLSWGGMLKDSFLNHLSHNYYLNENGVMLTGWQEIYGNWYHFRSWGGGDKGWTLLSRDGSLYTNDYWHFFDDNGMLVTDSDCLGCSEGQNTFSDRRNITITNNRSYSYANSSASMYNSEILGGISLWEDRTDLQFAESESGINLTFDTSSQFSSDYNQNIIVNGIAYVYYFDDDLGEIENYPSNSDRDWIYARIVLNSDSNASVNNITVAHEIGHTLGLSHQITNTTSIMCSPLWHGNASVLSDVDVNTYYHLY